MPTNEMLKAGSLYIVSFEILEEVYLYGQNVMCISASRGHSYTTGLLASEYANEYASGQCIAKKGFASEHVVEVL